MALNSSRFNGARRPLANDFLCSTVVLEEEDAITIHAPESADACVIDFDLLLRAKERDVNFGAGTVSDAASERRIAKSRNVRMEYGFMRFFSGTKVCGHPKTAGARRYSELEPSDTLAFAGAFDCLDTSSRLLYYSAHGSRMTESIIVHARLRQLDICELQKAEAGLTCLGLLYRALTA